MSSYTTEQIQQVLDTIYDNFYSIYILDSNEDSLVKTALFQQPENFYWKNSQNVSLEEVQQFIEEGTSKKDMEEMKKDYILNIDIANGSVLYATYVWTFDKSGNAKIVLNPPEDAGYKSWSIVRMCNLDKEIWGTDEIQSVLWITDKNNEDALVRIGENSWYTSCHKLCSGGYDAYHLELLPMIHKYLEQGYNLGRACLSGFVDFVNKSLE